MSGQQTSGMGERPSRSTVPRMRAAAEEDMPRILEIERESISPPWTHGGLLSEILSDDSFFELAERGDSFELEDGSRVPPLQTILGFVILRRIADEGELLQIAVDSEYRRRGIADTLIESALGWAHDCGISKIYLEVRKSNNAAIKLYKKHGFKRAGIRKDYYIEPIEDAVVMAVERRNARC